MATYTCKRCGVSKNDTISSQLNTKITCTHVNKEEDFTFHQWEKISEEDLNVA